MAKKKRKKPLKPITPNSQITNVIRKLWMYSRERGERLRLDNSTCWTCGRKASAAKGREVKVEVHHIDPVQMDRIIAVIREELLIPSDGLMTLCKDCHRAEHKTLKPEWETAPAQWVKDVKVYDRILTDEEIRG